MQSLSAGETAGLLPYTELARELRSVLRDKQTGEAYAPGRLAVPLAEEGVLLVMPAADGELAVTKLVTVHPSNAALGLQTIQGEVVVMEAETGRRLRLLEGETVTARRTAALSLLAARMLAPDPGGPLLIVGAGVQARAHLEAFMECLGTREVYLTSRTRDRAEALASYARQLGASARVVGEPGGALERTTLIVAATSSDTPVLPEGVREDAFVAAVGAHRAEAAELAPGLLHRGKLYVDDLEGARNEAGDLIQAGVDWASVAALEAVLEAARPERGPVIFKSVGHALWDLAAARLVERQVRHT